MKEIAIPTLTNHKQGLCHYHKPYPLQPVLIPNAYQRLHRLWIPLFERYSHLNTLLAYQQPSELVVNFLKGNEHDGI